MPKPSASSPPQRSRHGVAKTSAARVQARERVVVGDASEERHAVVHPAVRGPGLEPVPVAPGAGDGQLRVGEPGDRVDQHVEALAWHQAAHPEHQRPVGIQPEGAPGLGTDRVVDRVEALDVDAGRHDHPAQRATCGPLGLARRVVPRRHDSGGSAQHPAAELPAAGEAAGHRHLGAVHDGDVRRGRQARAEVPERQPRVEEDHVGLDLARQRVDAPRQRRGREELPLRRAHDAERLLRVPCRVTGVAGREHGGVLHREAPPQLVEVRLDAPDLRREVVGDEERGHWRVVGSTVAGPTSATVGTLPSW